MKFVKVEHFSVYDPPKFDAYYPVKQTVLPLLPMREPVIVGVLKCNVSVFGFIVWNSTFAVVPRPQKTGIRRTTTYTYVQLSVTLKLITSFDANMTRRVRKNSAYEIKRERET